MSDESPRFEDVDWDAVDRRGRLFSGERNPARYLAGAALALAFLYDYLVAGETTIPAAGVDISRLDWLFILTLWTLCFYVVVPLYENRRLTAYYWREFRRNRLAVVSMAYLLVVFAIGLVGPLVLEPPTLAITESYQPPVGFSVSSSLPASCVGEIVNGRCQGTMAHPFGTTQGGRDVLKYIIFGMRVSMEIGLIGSLIVIVIGTSVGTVAAYLGGMVDEVLMRYVDIQQTFPVFFLYLLINFLFEVDLFLLIIIFSVFSWGGIARLVRSEALQRREEGYVVAATSTGASTAYVIRRHLIPNVSSTVITAATLLIPGLLLFEAGLSFLGLGAGAFSWGEVIAAGRSNLAQAWWVSTLPGVFLFTTILAFNYMGDALRDALDPREGQT